MPVRVGIAGTQHDLDYLGRGAEPWFRVYRGDHDLIFPEYGRVFAFDDEQQMFNIPFTDPTTATEIADLGPASDQVSQRGMVNEGVFLYAVRADIIINPRQNEMWRYGQDGSATKLGVFPMDGTASIDAIGACAWDPDDNEFYVIQRDTATSSRVFRVAGTGVGGAFESTADTERLIFPNTTAALATLAANVHAAAYYDGHVYAAVDRTIRKAQTGQATLVFEDVGDLPGSAGAMTGMTVVEHWMVGVDSEDRFWRWPPDNPANAVQMPGAIAGVSGEIECLAYVPPENLGNPTATLSLANFSATGDVQMAMRITAGLFARSNGQVNLWASADWTADGAAGQVGTIEEGSADIVAPDLSLDFDLRRIARSPNNMTEFILNSTGGNLGQITGFTNTIYRVTIVRGVLGGHQMFTVAESNTEGASFATWRGSVASQFPAAAAEIVNAIAAGDSVIIAIHEGVASYAG